MQGPFDEAVADLRHDTGVKLSKRSAEQIVEEAAVDFDAFYAQHQAAARPERTGPVVVTGIDCKGVPMIRPEQTLRKVPPQEGGQEAQETPGHGGVGPHAAQTRADARGGHRQPVPGRAKEKQPQPRQKPPRPAEHKRVWADLLASKDEVIAAVAAEVKRTDPQGVKTHVALCDGERALQRRIVPALLGVVPAVILILDLLHVLEKMWLVAHCFYAEGSEAEATAWMRADAAGAARGRGRGDRGMRRPQRCWGFLGRRGARWTKWRHT